MVKSTKLSAVIGMCSGIPLANHLLSFPQINMLLPKTVLSGTPITFQPGLTYRIYALRTRYCTSYWMHWARANFKSLGRTST